MKRDPKRNRLRVNEQIRIREVRVIGPEGQQLGILPTKEALQAAKSYGLDLVEIAPKSRPPVCRIVDYGKMRYEQTKKEKLKKKKQSQQQSKTIQLKPNIGDNDLARKINDIGKFLDKGSRVVVLVTLKGRQKKFQNLAKEQTIEKIQQAIPDAKLESVQQQGGRITAVFIKAPLA